jgi:hypothetical protein
MPLDHCDASYIRILLFSNARSNGLRWSDYLVGLGVFSAWSIFQEPISFSENLVSFRICAIILYASENERPLRLFIDGQVFVRKY